MMQEITDKDIEKALAYLKRQTDDRKYGGVNHEDCATFLHVLYERKKELHDQLINYMRLVHELETKNNRQRRQLEKMPAAVDAYEKLIRFLLNYVNLQGQAEIELQVLTTELSQKMHQFEAEETQ